MAMKTTSGFSRLVFLILGLLSSTLAFAQNSTIIPPAVGDYAQEVDSLVWVLLGICGVIFLLVVTLTTVFLIRYRARKSTEDGSPVRGNHTLEIVWTAIPLAIMIFLVVLSVRLIYVQYEPPEDTLVIKVNAYAFDWDFEYYETANAGNEVDETVGFICGNPDVFVKIKSLDSASNHTVKIPVGRPVRFLISSEDVLHSFWVPEFRIKRDAVPDYVTDAWITPDRLGRYTIKCAELCGADHGIMLGVLEVVSEEEFDAWIAETQVAQL